MPAPTKGSFAFASSLGEFKIDRSGDPEAKGAYQMVGLAAVFGRLSHDLGGFRTRIQPKFFSHILDTAPKVHLNREHDMRMLLASTRTGALELSEVPTGLRVWSRWSKTDLAEETAVLMADGTLDEMSFACDIGKDRWTEDEDGNITRDLLECAGLYDVAICAQGAFPQTNAGLLASMSDAEEAFARAKAEGRIQQPDPKGASTISVPDSVVFASLTEDGLTFDLTTNLDVDPLGDGAGQEIIAPGTEGGTEVAPDELEGARVLAALKASAKDAKARHHPE